MPGPEEVVKLRHITTDKRNVHYNHHYSSHKIMEEEQDSINTIDQLLRAIADRQSPSRITPFSFNSFADAALVQGEQLFGARNTAERKRHALLYGKYRKQAIRGSTSLGVDADYSFWSESGGPLDKSDALVVLLNPNSQSHNSPLRSRHNSPLRPTARKRTQSISPTRNQTQSITPTMSGKQEVKKEVLLYDTLCQHRHDHPLSFDHPHLNPCGYLPFKASSEIDKGVYTEKGGVIVEASCPSETKYMAPVILHITPWKRRLEQE